MIFFLNKNTDFCWEIAKIFKSWRVRTPSSALRGRHIPDDRLQEQDEKIQMLTDKLDLFENNIRLQDIRINAFIPLLLC
jgi:hypothetical protein